MTDKHTLTLDTQVAQARKVKALTAENAALRAERDALAAKLALVEDTRAMESGDGGRALAAAESRAAALTDALRNIEALNYAFAATNGCAYTAHLIARAALAGNGNGTGGDGWIACRERLPECGRYASHLVLVRFANGRPTVGWCGTDGNGGWLWHTDARLDEPVIEWRPIATQIEPLPSQPTQGDTT